MNNSSIESLFENIEDCSKTTLELLKLKTIERSAEVVSMFAKQLVFYIMLVLLALVISIGLALWLGDLLGKPYYGFFVLSVAYALITFIIRSYLHLWVKVPVNNFIIAQMLKQN